ncbi:MAG: Protein flp [Chroococcopsis gigantea SAG 12.99]|jgi:CubicO group peptidase (beta-lactamase class C family)|nr:beta-lactamase family protein [Chlorogloea purpurea SAG 13.99]MDV3000721.1 Protein flp [Chroococcopsis gigantea SAG 12.99]
MLKRRQFLQYALMGLSGFTLATFPQRGLTINFDLDSIEERIVLLMKKYLIPGLSIALIEDGQLVYSRGFGFKNRQTLEPVDQNTIFAAASLSKPLFSYGVLKLVEEGKLDLDTPLTQYTEKPYSKDPRIKLVTARRVLSHTTGFPNWSGNSPVWFNNTPGKKFGYSGEAFVYLQKVVERLTFMPLAEYMAQNFLLPLGMSESSFIWKPSYEYMASSGHNRQGKSFAMNKPEQALSAGSLRTTAVDYAQFLLAMMDTESNKEYGLSQETLTQMLTPQVKISSSLSWGLGWGLESIKSSQYFWHWGDSGVFKSFTMGSRESKTAIVVLTNSENGLKICEPIVNLVLGSPHPAFRFSMINY